MRMRTSIFKNPPPHPHTEWVGLLHTLPRTPPNLFLIDTASDSQPDRRKLIIVLISITVFFVQPSKKEWRHFKPSWIGHVMRFTNLFFLAHILKASSATPTEPQTNLNFPQICPKIPQNDPKMTQKGPK